MAERISNPMDRIAELAGGQTGTPPATAPTAPAADQTPATHLPVMPPVGRISRTCLVCKATSEWTTGEMPPKGCLHCRAEWGTTSAPTAPAPKKAGRPKKEKATEAAPDQTPAMDPAAAGDVDYREIIEARTRELIAKHGLNELQAKPVGTGTVLLIGFTHWVEKEGDRLPQTFYREMGEDSETFMNFFYRVREKDRTVAMDVALVNALSPEIAGIAYRGEVDASLWDGRNGRVRVFPGARVKIGARLSKKGRVLWSVLGVEA